MHQSLKESRQDFSIHDLRELNLYKKIAPALNNKAQGRLFCLLKRKNNPRLCRGV